MNDVLVLLSAMPVNSYLALWLIVFLGSAVIPLPVDPLLLAAGALAVHGELNIIAVALTAISAAAAGDSVGYLIGRNVGTKAVDWLERSRLGRRIMPSSMLQRGHAYFTRYGSWAVFLSRWLVGAFSSAVNLLAGIRRFPFAAFLVYAGAGEVVDIGIMLALGAAVGSRLAAANNALKVVSLAILGVISIGIVVARLLSPLWHPRLPIPQHKAE